MGMERTYTDIVAHNITGSVEWFNWEKGFGFIVSDGGERAFLHMSDVYAKPEDYPEKGDRLIYDLRSPAKGLQAVNAHYVERRFERMRESLKGVAAAICEKDSYTGPEFEAKAAAALEAVNKQYREGTDALCKAYTDFVGALENMIDLSCGVEQLQNMLNLHEPVEAHRTTLPNNTRMQAIRAGLSRGGVAANMEVLLKERSK